MADFERQEGISFFLIRWEPKELVYLLPYRFVADFVERSKTGGRKSIPLAEIQQSGFLAEVQQGYFVHYLEALNKYLQTRNKEC